MTASFSLIIDTSLGACSVGLYRDGARLWGVSEAMQRGHQERLAVMAFDAFREVGVKARNLTHIGVTLGPGSFTGMRVGLAFAKGLAVGLGISPKGVGTLEALGHHVGFGGRRRLSVIDGGRGQVFVQRFDGSDGHVPQVLADADAVAAFADAHEFDALTGPGAHLVAAHWPKAELFAQAWPDLDALYALAQMPGHDDLTPLYLREADAKASTHGIIILDAPMNEIDSLRTVGA